ncbi:MAG: DUF3850 domain-containing protein [Clostridia bacterium]|nr:DUF3850 domain-containing protein [Clostridia bacterium]
MIHELKILPEYFYAVISGEKTFELRVNDRNFQKGDYLALNEYYGGKYTGRSCMVYVDYILTSANELLPKNVVAMSIEPCQIIKTRESSEQYIEAPSYWSKVPVIEECEI